MKASIIFGTRPEIIKLSMLVKLAIREPSVDLDVIHTGQHYSHNLSERFLKDLELPHIREDLAIGSHERLDQLRKMVHGLSRALQYEKPDVVVVQGDTNSALAGAIAGRNTGIPVAHVEAGIRCFDPMMVEEINRTVTDRICDLRFAPTEVSVQNLEREGYSEGSVMLVGNTIVEVVLGNLEVSHERSRIMPELGLEPCTYVLVTAHRQENVDDHEMLSDLVSGFERIRLPMVYPIHPRTVERIAEFGLLRRLEAIENLQIIDPLPYWDFLELSRNSRMIITDSGGIQEECTIYKKPIIVVRDCTERPEILGSFGVMPGSDPDRLLAAVERIDRDFDAIVAGLECLPSPYGDGTASRKILDTLMDTYG